MKRTLPIASHPAAFASTPPPISDNVMTIPSDISTFMTVLLFAGLVPRSALYCLRRNVYPDSVDERKMSLPGRPEAIHVADMIRGGFLDASVREDLIALVRDGKAETRLTENDVELRPQPPPAPA